MNLRRQRPQKFRLVVKSQDKDLVARVSELAANVKRGVDFEIETRMTERDAYLHILRSIKTERAIDVIFWDAGAAPKRETLEMFARVWEADESLGVVVLSDYPDYYRAAMSNSLGDSERFDVLATSASGREFRHALVKAAADVLQRRAASSKQVSNRARLERRSESQLD